MAKYIKIHNTIVNVESISKVEFISDDIHMGLFPKNEQGKILIDYDCFEFAKIELFSGEVIRVQVDLYPPEQGETEESWAKRNRVYINLSWTKLIESLGEIDEITGFEYEFGLEV